MHSTFFFLKRDYLGIGEGSRGLEWGQRETERRVNLRPGYTTRGSVFKKQEKEPGLVMNTFNPRTQTERGELVGNAVQ